MTVTARDQGIPAKTATVVVQVNVLRNAYNPVFTQEQYTKTIMENITYDSIFLDLHATDNDSIAQPGVSSSIIYCKDEVYLHVIVLRLCGPHELFTNRYY